MSTRERILEVAIDRFGRFGLDAVSLDDIATAVGVRKQTVLYWFATKDELVDAVFAAAAGALGEVISEAIDAAPDDPLERIDRVVVAVFRNAVRHPALLGLMRQLGRLTEARAVRLGEHLQPLVERAIVYLGAEMDRGALRRGDPRLVAALATATVTGAATDTAVLRAVGWRAELTELRKLRRELRAFLHAALRP